MPEGRTLKAAIPEKLGFLFRPAPYKVARGGRGSAKSWSFARALLLLGMQNKLRILCAREIQLSIKQSVHKLLSDQIELLDIGNLYTVFAATIQGKNGTEFSFTGLNTLTVDTIKSYEGTDICWVEEGQVITKRSWDILIPTIRKQDSEIWISYNPDLETDETHQRFTINPPKGTINVVMNWRDNPWFNENLDQKRLHCKRFRPDDYDNIWEGKCRPAEEGAIFYKQMQQVIDQGRIRAVPYDPLLKVHLVFDQGWRDSQGCILAQKVASEIRIIEYLEASQTTWNDYSVELRTRPYNWGRVFLPHDGHAKRIESNGRSSADILEALGWVIVPRVEIVELPLEEGIKQTRLRFPQLYFDKDKTDAFEALPAATPDFHATEFNGRLVECCKRYKRNINQKTEGLGEPARTPHTHGADTLRYMALNADLMLNEANEPQVDVNRFNVTMPVNDEHARNGWMAA